MAKEFNQNKYIQEFNKSHYDRIEIKLPNGQKDIIKHHAAAAGKSLTEYIYQAIKEKMDSEFTGMNPPE